MMPPEIINMPETDAQRLARYAATLAFWEARTGSTARINASHYRRAYWNLRRHLEWVAAHPEGKS